MDLDVEKQVLRAIEEGIRAGVKSKLDGYNSPLAKLIEDSLSKHSGTMRALLEDSIASCLTDPTFREDIATSVRHQLAKTLVQRFGGEMEKQVNVLKSDPTTRARITLAIEEIVKTKAS